MLVRGMRARSGPCPPHAGVKHTRRSPFFERVLCRLVARVRRSGWLICVLLSLLWLGCHVSSPRPKLAPNAAFALQQPKKTLVLLTIDSVRVQHMGAYGYGRPTTPHFDRLAQSGVLFRRAYAQAPHTSFSIASLLTGRYFAPLHRLLPGEQFPTLASELKAQGWATAAVYPPAVYVTDPQILAPYKADHFGFQHVRCDYISADQSIDEAIRFLETQQPARALLWIHLFEPHEPYQAGGDPSFGKTAVDRYDQELVVVDAALGRLVRYLAAGRPDTTWVISADHGEAFHEHGESLHGTNLYEEQIRVPLLVAGPGVQPGVVDDPVQLVDVMPTLLQRAGSPSSFELDGRDLTPALSGQRLPPRSIYASLGDQHATVAWPWKLIWDRQPGRDQLYNLADDPTEQHNQIARHREQASTLRHDLQGWLDERMRSAQRVLTMQGAALPDEGLLRARSGDASAASALVDLLQEPAQSVLHSEASRLLVRLRLPGSLLPRLRPLLQHADQPVADRAHVAALKLGASGSLPRVLQIAGSAVEDLDLRLAAAHALMRLRPVKALHTFVDLMDRYQALGDYRHVREAVLALGTLRDRRAVPALRRRLDNAMVQLDVMAALGQIAAMVTVAPLIHHLQHDDRVPARIAAAQALSRIPTRQARAALRQAARQDPEAMVRKTAAQPR